MGVINVRNECQSRARNLELCIEDWNHVFPLLLLYLMLGVISYLTKAGTPLEGLI